MTSAIEEKMIRIWQCALERPTVSVDEDFFELGGTPALAVAIFRKLEEITGRRVSPFLIYEAPTIAALARAWDSQTAEASPSVFKLKRGSPDQAVFLAHGLGGSIMDFFGVLQFVRTPLPIYGLQARGMDGTDEPCASIEEMAQFHMKNVKTVQPRGPYVLIGYSLGGLVTLELARLLAVQGEKIALLLMIDAYPPLHQVSRKERLKVRARRTIDDFKALARLSSRIFSRNLPRKTSLLSVNGSDASMQSSGLPLYVGSFTPAMEKVKQSARLAWEDYDPRYYDGTVKFIRAKTSLHFPDDPALFWSRRVRHFEVETVPGNHDTLLTQHSDALAKVISRHLEECENAPAVGA